MKKKILITLFIAVLICLFAFSVSAANEVTLTDGTTANLETVFVVDGSTVKGFNTNYSKSNVKSVVFPSNITTVKSIDFSSSTVLESVTFESTSTLTLDNVAFRESSIQKATFNPECVLNYKSGSFYGCKSMTEITFPKFASITNNCFQGNSKMVPTNGVVFVEGIETIACHVFNGCTNVGGTVTIPASVKEIKEYTFCGTSITAFDFSKCTNLTTIGGGYGNVFANIDTITSLDFSKCTSLTTFNGNSMFEGCAELTAVILPDNLAKIPHKTFAHCYKMQSIVIPATVTEIVNESFHSARAGQSVKTFTMYIQGNVKLDTKYVFRDSSTKVEFVLLGDSINAEQFKTTNAGIDIVQSGSHSPLDNIEVISYTGSENPWTFTPGQARDSHIIVEDYCTNLALKGAHKEGENPCVIFCADCLFSQAKENPLHVLVTTIKYANGYTSAGVKLTACSNEGCLHKNEEETKALFTCQGYSYGSSGILIGFTINKNAISAYTEATGKTLSYGLFAGLETKLGTNEAISTAGIAQNGAVSVDFTTRNYDIMEIKVVGFKTSDHKEAKVILGAYVIETNGNEKTVSYLQSGEVAEGKKYVSKSYNDLAPTN